MDLQEFFNARQSRRSVLQQLGMLAGGSLILDACAQNNPPTTHPNNGPASINHVLVACQENRSFDAYFGYYPHAGKFGVPPNSGLASRQGGLRPAASLYLVFYKRYSSFMASYS